jgi:hypothetical protein
VLGLETHTGRLQLFTSCRVPSFDRVAVAIETTPGISKLFDRVAVTYETTPDIALFPDRVAVTFE